MKIPENICDNKFNLNLFNEKFMGLDMGNYNYNNKNNIDYNYNMDIKDYNNNDKNYLIIDDKEYERILNELKNDEICGNLIKEIS
jgi:hypothetical protein